MMQINEILSLLPHRYPFVYVDRVMEYDSYKTITARKNVSINEHFFLGHFPGKPVMPGVLIVEALAQTAAILAYKSVGLSPKTAIFYLGSVDDAKFRNPVVPGDILELNIEIIKQRSNVWKCRGEALVDGKTSVTCDLSSMLSKD